MPSEVVMPRLGWTMEVGRVVEWLKNDGDAVEAGDIILAIESDKAINEVEAFDSGILRIPADQQIGVELPVGAPLGFIVQPGEPDPFAGAPAAVAVNPTQAVSVRGNGCIGAGRDRTNRFRVREQWAYRRDRHRSVRERGGQRSRLVSTGRPSSGSGSSGRIREVDVLAAIKAQPSVEPVRAAPSVRQLADIAGVDLSTVPPGRIPGRVTRMDVLSAAQPTAASVSSSAPAAVGPVRRVIMERMMETVRTVAPVTLTTDANASELVRIRELFKTEMGSDNGPIPSFNDMIIRLVALALLEHPELNASLTRRRHRAARGMPISGWPSI